MSIFIFPFPMLFIKNKQATKQSRIDSDCCDGTLLRARSGDAGWGQDAYTHLRAGNGRHGKKSKEN